MTEKMTYTKALETVISAGEGIYSAEVIEKLSALKASLEKRASAKVGKETKAQKEAREFTETVFKALSEQTEGIRCKDLAELMSTETEVIKPQKISAAMSKLVKAGRVVKFEGEKKASFFKLA